MRRNDDTISDQITSVCGRAPVGEDAPRGEVIVTTDVAPGGGVVSGADEETHVASTVVGGSDLSPLPHLTVAEYCERYPGSFDVRRFKAMHTDGCNLVIYERRRCPLDTALGTWQKR